MPGSTVAYIKTTRTSLFGDIMWRKGIFVSERLARKNNAISCKHIWSETSLGRATPFPRPPREKPARSFHRRTLHSRSENKDNFNSLFIQNI